MKPAAKAPPLTAALPVVLDALAAATQREKLRAELRCMLPLLLDTNAPVYRQRLAELLAGLPRARGHRRPQSARCDAAGGAAPTATVFTFPGVAT